MRFRRQIYVNPEDINLTLNFFIIIHEETMYPIFITLDKLNRFIYK